MVFGFLAAMALLNGSGRVIGKIFSVFGFASDGEGFLGLAGFLAFSLILGLAALAAAWKFFGLSVTLPDRVLSWVGLGLGGDDSLSQARDSQARFQGALGVQTRIAQVFSRSPAILKGPPKAKP
jgi:hypothetical protein